VPRVADRFVIETDEDWRTLAEQEASVVLDPTAIRVAELFLRGRRYAGENTWAAIKANVSSLATFFDSLVLYEHIPLFDYALTFPRSASEVLGDLSICEPVVIPVAVQPNAYTPIQLDVIARMRMGTSIPQELTAQIRAELDALGWTYESRLFGNDLSGSAAAGDPSGDALVNSFLYVGLLFAGYAQELQGIHVVPPTLSKLQLAAALGGVDGAPLDERLLWRDFLAGWNAVPEGQERTLQLDRPSFLPYLLTFDDPSPAHLVDRALHLRDDAAVQEYRAWLREVCEELDKGRLSLEKRKDTQRVAGAFARQLAHRRDELSANVGVQVSVIGIPTASVETEIDFARLRDWLLASRPGKRYQKLLLKLAVAQESYIAIDRHLELLWNAI
jgi:hypothetical protein